jgi:hypothetical protein
MTRHIRGRGERCWELKFDTGRDPASGAPKVAYHSFKGTKRQAQARLAELITRVGKGAYVARSAVTVGEHVTARIDQWETRQRRQSAIANSPQSDRAALGR